MTADSSDEEAKLVLLAIAGSDDAFSELVLRRQDWLRSLLRRLSRDDALADDLCQSAFLQAWRNIGKLNNHAVFASWLRRIAIRGWADHARAQKLSFDDVDPNLSAAPAGPGGVATADYRMDLETALGQLRPGPRACIVLFYGEGMTHSEVAAATGLSIGVVKSHIARATQRLQKILHDWRAP